MKLMSVVGARPNFMKIAPFVRAVNRWNESLTGQEPAQSPSATASAASGTALHAKRTETIDHVLVHTGQHYDERMSAAFFDALDIPRPDVDLGIGSGTHAEQVGRTMIAFERVLKEHNPDWVIVVGDVNATCACSITARKEHVPLAHIEAGLRSFDTDMPEEINRMVTDRLANLLFTTDDIASQNLIAEGVPAEAIQCVGNIMIDTLEAQRDRAAELDIDCIVAEDLLPECDSRKTCRPLGENTYAIVTLHRPSNVDDANTLNSIVRFITDEVCRDMSVVWPVHPRTAARLRGCGLWENLKRNTDLFLLRPLGYHQLLRLNMSARLMLTDSGGLQEECCVLGTPCVTLRHNTERPVTLVENGGVSMLAGNQVDRIRDVYAKAKSMPRKSCRPPLWDGHTADRIVAAFC